MADKMETMGAHTHHQLQAQDLRPHRLVVYLPMRIGVAHTHQLPAPAVAMATKRVVTGGGTASLVQLLLPPMSHLHIEHSLPLVTTILWPAAASRQPSYPSMAFVPWHSLPNLSISGLTASLRRDDYLLYFTF